MEDALVQGVDWRNGNLDRVLILVLMEDALVPLIMELLRKKRKRLNPCFNGRCTRTNQVLWISGIIWES